MLQKLLRSKLLRDRFVHYFVIISALTFLFTQGPRILVDQLSSSNPNTALAQDCGQQPCPSVPEVPTPPPSCSEHDRDFPQCGGTCNGTTFPSSHTVMVHQRVDQASCQVSFQCEDQGIKAGECGNLTETPAPQPTPAQCTPNEVIGTTQHCNGTQMCTFNIHHRADCSTFEGGPFACQNLAQCGFSTPVPQACTDQLFDCSCNGTDFKCMHRHTGCDVSVETHNELAGAAACRPGASQLPSNAACTDRVMNCTCSGTTQSCQHQHSDCSVTAETTANATACQPGTAPRQGGNSSSSSSSNSSSTSNSSSSSSATANAQQQQQQTQSQSLTNVNNINNTNNNTNTSSSGNNTQTVTANIVWMTPTPTASPTPVSISVGSQCPAGTTFQRMENNTIFCTPNSTTSVTNMTVGQGGGTPQVVSKTQVQGQVQELPNTGLPIGGLAILGLVPLGWKLRRYALRSFTHPADIWMGRELKK